MQIRTRGRVALSLAAFSVVGVSTTFGQTLAFPEAEGFGRFATGARTSINSASIYHVTNLNDSGAGSFRDAVSQSNRFIVFDVGGMLKPTSPLQFASNLTIAGQTAPGGFVVFDNRAAFHGANNLISRHWAVRLGRNQGREDTAGIVRGSNMIFDHMSITWGVDGTFDINPDSGETIDNLTIQKSIIGQGLDVVGHSTGGLMTLGTGNRFSIIKSLLIDNATRNPKVRGENEFINNVVYGYEDGGYLMGDTSATSHANAEGNYFIHGEAQRFDHTGALININPGSPFSSGSASFNIYGRDNWVDTDRDGVLDGVAINNYPGSTVMGARNAFPTVASMTAREAVQYVIDHVGASVIRDAVDQRLADEVASYGTIGKVLVRETELFPGYGTDAKYLNPRARLVDTDNDGMPDNWETSRGLNPNSNTTGEWRALVGGFTRLETYLNELGADGETILSTGGNWATAATTWNGNSPTFADSAIVVGNLTLNTGNAFARRLASGGTFNMSGGTLDVFDTGSLDGVSTISGGVASFGRVVLAAPTKAASLTLGAGGTLQTATIESGGGSPTLTLNGGTFKAIGAPSIAVPTAIAAAGGTINTNGFDGSITGGLSGTGALTKAGNGTLTLGGNNSAFSGEIKLNGGAVTLAPSASGNGSTGVITAANGTTVNVNVSNVATPLALASGATVNLIPNGGLTYGGAISGPAGSTLMVSSSSSGTSNFSLGGVMGSFAGTINLGTSTGNVRINQGGSALASFNLGTSTATLRVANGGTTHLGSLTGVAGTRLTGSTNSDVATTFSIGANGASTTFAGTIADGTFSTPSAVGLTKTGAGTLTLSNAASTFTGPTTLSGGVLSVASITDGGVASAIGMSAAGASSLVFDGGTLRYTGGATQVDRTFTLTQNGGTIEASGSNTLQFRDGGGPIVLAGTGNRTLTLAGTNTGWNTLERELADPASGKTSLTKSGAGTWRLLNATSTYTGNTTIDGGTLIAWWTNSIPNGAGKGNVVVNGSGILDMNGTNHTFNGLDGNGTVVNAANTRTLTLGNGNASGSFAGSINSTGGTLSLTKIGSGTQTLGGTSSYAGNTLVSGGKLVVNGSINSSAVAVQNNAAIGGSGSLLSLVANAGSFVAPGNSIDSMEVVNNATLDGTLQVELNGAGTGSVDLLDVGGQLDITGAAVTFAIVTGGQAADDGAYIFARYGSLVGTFGTNISGLPAGYTIDYQYNNGTSSNNIALVPIPEPMSVGLIAAPMACLLRRRR